FTYRNLMITMVLGGLWHGASWNFVIWGALHGGALAVNRMWQRSRQKKAAAPIGTPYRDGAPAPAPAAPAWTVGRVISIVATFHFVCFAWIFFRAPTFNHAVLVLQRLGKLTLDAPNL